VTRHFVISATHGWHVFEEVVIDVQNQGSKFYGIIPLLSWNSMMWDVVSLPFGDTCPQEVGGAGGSLIHAFKAKSLGRGGRVFFVLFVRHLKAVICIDGTRHPRSSQHFVPMRKGRVRVEHGAEIWMCQSRHGD
jgi:hypothetical protein